MRRARSARLSTLATGAATGVDAGWSILGLFGYNRGMDENRSFRSRLTWLAFSAVGLLPLGIGAFNVLLVVAFSSMVDPRLAPNERRARILSNLFLTPTLVVVLGGSFLIVAGVQIVLYGFMACFFPTRPKLYAPRGLMALSAALAVSAVIALLLAVQ
jgi:hypothetical protein